MMAMFLVFCFLLAYYVCMCVHWSPDRAIWPNYEVVEFQSRSGIVQVLDSAASKQNFYSIPLPHLSYPLFGSFYFTPWYHPISSGCHRCTYLSHSIPTSSPEKMPSTWMFPSLAICQPLSNALRPALCPALCVCVCRRILRPFALPFSALGLQPGPCQPLGVRPPRIPPYPLCYASLPMCCTNSHHLLVFGSLGVYFAWGQGSRVPPLPGSRSSCPPPPCYMDTPEPSPPPPLLPPTDPSPLVVLIQPPMWEED